MSKLLDDLRYAGGEVLGSTIEEQLSEARNLYAAGLKEGHRAGYAEGFRDATAQAKAIIERAFPHFEKETKGEAT